MLIKTDKYFLKKYKRSLIVPTNPVCLLHGQFSVKAFLLIFAWMKTYKQKGQS